VVVQEVAPTPQFRIYAIGLAWVAGAVALRLALHPILRSTSLWVTFWPAVFLAARQGGLRGGLTATAASTIIVFAWFLPDSLLRWEQVLVGAAVFVVCGVAFAWVVEREQRNRSSEQRLRLMFEETNRRMRALVDLASVLASTSSLDDVARAVVTEGKRASRADTAMLYAVDDANASLRLVAESGTAPEVVAEIVEIALDSKHGARLSIEQWAEAAAEYVENMPEIASIETTHRRAVAYWSMPLSVAGRIVGVLAMGYFTPQRFSPEEREFVRLFAQHCAQAVARAERTARAERERVRADTANRAKDEFLAMLGHELRNPLAPITTALELIEMKGAASSDRALGIIRRQVVHLTKLVGDLLDVSRIHSGKIELAREPIEIATVLEHAVETVSPLIEERRHRLTFDVPAHGLVVDGDAQRLAQVFGNVVANAAKYTEPGGAIRVVAAASGDTLVVTISDNGIGIDEAMLSRVFEVFEQERQMIDRSRGGLGLGLAIARALLTLHGGTIEVASDGKHRGSTFTIRLPLATIDASTSEAVPPAMPLLDGAAARTVLVVDDNHDAAALLTALAEQRGHAARAANDGPSALRMLAEFRPDVALLDLGLPAMDGFELAQRIRQIPSLSKIRLVAVTGYSQPGDRERTRAAGFDLHLVKPIALEDVIRAIEGGSG
jgi:K+-sensing histidine kinase KdpD/CheY-like chemotaxis protein